MGVHTLEGYGSWDINKSIMTVGIACAMVTFVWNTVGPTGTTSVGGTGRIT